MNKNLRSKKASEGATETREDSYESIQEFRILAANLTAKMDELTAQCEQEPPRGHPEQVAAVGRELDYSMQ